MKRIKMGVLTLMLAGLALGGLAGCGASGAYSTAPQSSAISGSAAATDSSVTSSIENKQVPNIPLSSPGPFAVYSGKQDDTLDVYTKADGAYIISLPYSMLTDFPAIDPWESSSSPELYDGLHVYCGSVGNFVWALLGSDSSMGIAFNSVCTSADGGETWQVGETNAMNVENLGGKSTGVNFVSSNVGFICFDPQGSNGSPGIARTLDGGKTWERMKVDIPAAMRKYAYFTPQSPVFTGDFGVIPLVCRDHAAETDTMEYLITTDGGLNWHWEQSTPK